MIYGNIREITEKDCIEDRYPHLTAKFELRNTAWLSQQ